MYVPGEKVHNVQHLSTDQHFDIQENIPNINSITLNNSINQMNEQKELNICSSCLIKSDDNNEHIFEYNNLFRK